MIKERRSVRTYQDKKVNREIIKEIVELSRWAPSWANFQVARYTLVDNEAKVKKLTEETLLGCNSEKLKSAKGIAVISYVKGKSGSMKDKYLTSKGGT